MNLVRVRLLVLTSAVILAIAAAILFAVGTGGSDHDYPVTIGYNPTTKHYTAVKTVSEFLVEADPKYETKWTFTNEHTEAVVIQFEEKSRPCHVKFFPLGSGSSDVCVSARVTLKEGETATYAITAHAWGTPPKGRYPADLRVGAPSSTVLENVDPDLEIDDSGPTLLKKALVLGSLLLFVVWFGLGWFARRKV